MYAQNSSICTPPLQPRESHKLHLYKIWSACPSDVSDQTWSQSVYPFKRSRIFKVKVDDGQRTLRHPTSSTWPLARWANNAVYRISLEGTDNYTLELLINWCKCSFYCLPFMYSHSPHHICIQQCIAFLHGHICIFHVNLYTPCIHISATLDSSPTPVVVSSKDVPTFVLVPLTHPNSTGLGAVGGIVCPPLRDDKETSWWCYLWGVCIGHLCLLLQLSVFLGNHQLQ